MSIQEPVNVASKGEGAAKKSRKSRASRSSDESRSRPPRLASRTVWALRDILREAKKARAEMQEILAWLKAERIDAKGTYDLARLNRLGELSHHVAELALSVAEIERTAADARIGVYNGAGHDATSDNLERN